LIAGQIRPPKEKEKFFALLKVEGVDGEEPDKAKDKTHFENLTPLFSQQALHSGNRERKNSRLASSTSSAPLAKARAVSIVAPPRTGKPC